ncbi:MAG TPA: FAD-dependent oxidoreductase [Prolixibacteraceae bacterium]|nr:FAD-dependent oxidoreductase [Prolixibacteraceae bacterium]
MISTKTILIIVLLSLLFSISENNHAKAQSHFDIVIYGGTSSGISAALQASRMGKSVVLIEPTSRIGGLTTGGLGQTDIGNKDAIGGISREFYHNIRMYYNNPKNWKWQKPQEYKDGGQTRTEDTEATMWTFEPSAALNVFQEMLEKEKVKLVFNQRLDRETGVEKKGNKIISITMESSEKYAGHMFVDATYEGDLMAASGVSYTIGREANNQYGETLDGIQWTDEAETILDGYSKNAANHNFVNGVDPYEIKGDPNSGLLPCISSNGSGVQGTGDKGIQAYCFRMCLTDSPENRIPFLKPDDYKELNYELLLRNFEAGEKAIPWINSEMPNRKTDTNNGRGFSTDFIGQNYNYPDASYGEREKIAEAHRNYQQGLMWTLANNPRIPEPVRKEVSRWGTCKDEFERKDGWQQQLYVREARRMISDYVMTQKNCEGIDVVDDPVGLAAYGMDSHHVKRYVTPEGFVKNEGNVEAHVKSPFPISYRSIVPKKEECTNLLVPVCMSATHIAFGSIRMEPVFMVLGQSAATAACMAIDKGVEVQKIDYENLKSILVTDKQVLQVKR